MNVVRTHRGQLFEYGPFTIRRLRPGERFGPLAIVDMITLKQGDVAGDTDALSTVTAERDATLICFLVDAEASGVMSGTVSRS